MFQVSSMKRAAFTLTLACLSHQILPVISPPGIPVAHAAGGTTATESNVIMLFLSLGWGTTVASTVYGETHDAQSKALSLIDEAYTGSGDKLETVARATNRTVEDVAETIVTLDQAHKLDARKPKRMAVIIADALAR